MKNASPLRSKDCRAMAVASNAGYCGTCGTELANDVSREHYVRERKETAERSLKESLKLSRQTQASKGSCKFRKRTIALALCCSLVGSPVCAKTFIGVLWPLFGPVAAIGLVELVGELRSMPDVEVATYLHQSWPALVEDINRQPKGTHILVIGYSLGANNSVLVANEVNHVDSIIALQPSMFTSNPSVTGNVGRIIEVYNPNPWMTFGGMGSQRLTGPNIEYVVNNDSHPGAQFNSEFRSLVKSEVARLSAEDELDKARAKAPTPPHRIKLPESPKPEVVKQRQPEREPSEPPKPEVVKQRQPEHELRAGTTFVDELSNSVNSGNLFAQRRLTIADMQGYAERTYQSLRAADALPTSVNSGILFVQRRLTTADMEDYAERRTYQSSTDASSVSVNEGTSFGQPQLTTTDMEDYAVRTYHLRQTNNGL